VGDLVLGVDMGGTKVLAAAVDAEGRIVAKGRIATVPQNGPIDVVARIARLLSELAEQAGVPARAIAAVAMGVPGQVDDAAGLVLQAPNLPGWAGLPLAELVRAHLGGTARVVLDNDVNLAILGEHVYGVGRGQQSMVGVERLGEDLVRHIREVAYEYFFRPEAREEIRIVPTLLKADAAPLGGAWLARRRLGLRPDTGAALY
jgi:predicted NBD/HSP70 family sugar kinase